MACKLRSYDVNPPGGYSYQQTQGIARAFPSEPLIEALAKNISAFRTGNNLPRASILECLEDADRYNCARLGCNKAWCVDIGSATGIQTTSINPTHPLVAPCKGCGAQLPT